MDEYLKALLEPTPLDRWKLDAAWEGLSTESQIALLSADRFPMSVSRAALGLRSSNPYVRYLTAESLKSQSRFDDKEAEALLRQATMDPDPLVQSLFAPSGFLHPVRPAEFWALPHASRLAAARNLASRTSDNQHRVEEILELGIANQLPESEVDEFAVEYLRASARVGASFGSHKKFWQFVRGLPGSLAQTMAYLAPFKPEDEEFWDTTIEGVTFRFNRYAGETGWFSGDVLGILLAREDVVLSEFRKRIFLSTEQVEPDYLRAIAAQRFLHLSDEEFLSVRGRRECLSALASAGPESLSLAQWEFLTSPGQDGWSNRPGKENEHLVEATAIGMVEKRAGLLAGWKRRAEITYLRILLLARDLSIAAAGGWKPDLWIDGTETTMPDALLTFDLPESTVVAGDTWATYLNLKKDLLRGRRSDYPHRLLPVHECMTENDLDPGLTAERRMNAQVAKNRGEALLQRRKRESEERVLIEALTESRKRFQAGPWWRRFARSLLDQAGVWIFAMFVAVFLLSAVALKWLAALAVVISALALVEILRMRKEISDRPPFVPR